MAKVRTGHDSMGEVNIPADRLWGAQTQRSLENFPIGVDRFRWPRSVIKALGIVKKSAALANAQLRELPEDLADLIAKASDEVIGGRLDEHFPLVVFQTGSGTHTNMNANEVIASRANILAGGKAGAKSPVHPNDHVNRGQSSNDVFPTVMHVAVADELRHKLLPAVTSLRDTFSEKSIEYAEIVKVGRTHYQDAAPLTLGQEISSWVGQLDFSLANIHGTERALYSLALGGTAVGTGLNAHPSFGKVAAALIAEQTGFPFEAIANPFPALAAHDALMQVSASLRTLAGALMKIANDIRFLGSGPRAGIGELILPATEPGSSIMPGKVNPTQCEALTMVCVRVYGNDAAVAFAGSQGNLELNVYKPVILQCILESISLLSDAVNSFDRRCASGITPNEDRIRKNLEQNLMLATALTIHIGYDKATQIAKRALEEDRGLREVAIASGYVTAQDYDRWVSPMAMTRPESSHA